MKILVFGAGSLGSLLGGLLARAHEVTLIGRDPHMRRVSEAGLTISGQVTEHVHPEAETEVDGLSVDAALVTVKSYDTPAAAEALKEADIGAVCSLQNGLGNEERLAETLSVPIVGGTVTYGADLSEPGEVRMTGTGDVTIGAFRAGEGNIVDTLASAFSTADIEVSVTDNIETTLWEKVAINAAINPTAALARCRNRAIVDRPLAAVATNAALETAAVARANGVELGDAAIRDRVLEVAEATGENRCSMLQDVLEGGRTEIDAINGAVVDRSGDVSVPVNETLSALVSGLEQYDLEEET